MGNLFNYRKKIKIIKLQFEPKDEIGGMECIMNSIYLIADKITKGKNISTYKMFLVLSVVTWLIGMSVITVPFFITGKIFLADNDNYYRISDNILRIIWWNNIFIS